MRKVAVRGLVKLAGNVRRELARPITPEQLQSLRRRVRGSLATIERMLDKAGADKSALSPQSRKAYLYLAGLDLDSVEPDATARNEQYRLESVRFIGLRAYFDGLLDHIAQQADADDLSATHADVCRTSDRLDQYMQERAILPEHLTSETRNTVAWFRYFSRPEHFDTYVSALRTAKSPMGQFATASDRFKPPVIIHFRPTGKLYRLRGSANGTLLHCPTAMVTLDARGFTALASLAIGRNGAKHEVVALTGTSAYRDVHEALRRLAGAENLSKGVFHDLAESFARVNADYFNGAMRPPRLSWSRHITGNRFGHYNHADDAVMVSSTLDAADVPPLVVDFIVYHELLHKKMGARPRNATMAVHTPEFRRQERQFKQFADAAARLGKLARHYA
ncbi:MAG: hypothetical protein JXQ73_06415 [Phycisphaerae bacterium]|nr:hypothetical protein [Phycisphaerae bacterium]